MPAAKSKHTGKAYVNVDLLSGEFPDGRKLLPRGTEVSDLLNDDVLEACLADGRVTRDAPESD